MSRTDKTEPLWMRQREHGPVEVHDHRHGPCDLPPEPTRESPDTRCRWERPESLLMGHGCCSGCQRRGCTAEWQDHVKAAHRRRRHGDRLLTRRWVREANGREPGFSTPRSQESARRRGRRADRALLERRAVPPVTP